jgi:hypothetical protein
VVELLAVRGKADFDIAQALPTRQLREGHRQKLLPTGKIPDASIPRVAIHETVKVIVRNKLQ